MSRRTGSVVTAFFAFCSGVSLFVAAVPAQEAPLAGKPTAGNEMAVLFGDAIPEKAPPRRDDEGVGPLGRLVIRGATLIDGTGAPPIGPVDIVIENDRIAEVVSVGSPALKLDDETGEVTRAGKVTWTIKDGVIYDAEQLRADVRRMVADQKALEAQEGQVETSGR